MNLLKTTTGVCVLILVFLTGCTANQTVSQSEDQAVLQQSKTETENPDSQNEDGDDIEISAPVISEGTTSLSDTEGTVRIVQKGTYRLTGKGKSVIIDAENQEVRLELDNVSLNSTQLPNLYIRKAEKVTVNLTGSNAMVYENKPLYESLNGAVYSRADLVFQGGGSLTVSSHYNNALKIKGEAEFQSGTYVLSAEENGIRTSKKLIFKGGSYVISAFQEGIESKTKLKIDDGKFVISSTDDCINASKSIEINGGEIYGVSTANDGIDSNGDLIINGGLVSIAGSAWPEHSFDTNDTPFEINGGKIIGIGVALVIPTGVKQPVLLIGKEIKEKCRVELKENGQSAAVFDLPECSQPLDCLLLSDPALKPGTVYTIYINDQKLEEVALAKDITYAGDQTLMKE